MLLLRRGAEKCLQNHCGSSGSCWHSLLVALSLLRDSFQTGYLDLSPLHFICDFFFPIIYVIPYFIIEYHYPLKNCLLSLNVTLMVFIIYFWSEVH